MTTGQSVDRTGFVGNGEVHAVLYGIGHCKSKREWQGKNGRESERQEVNVKKTPRLAAVDDKMAPAACKLHAL